MHKALLLLGAVFTILVCSTPTLTGGQQIGLEYKKLLTSVTPTGGLAFDPATRKLFVADASNHLVYRYGSIDSLNSSSTPETTLGDGTNSCGPNSFGPKNLFFHSTSGTLYVADQFNNRILGIQDAVTADFSSGASFVIGQNNLTDCSDVTWAQSLESIWLDGDNNFWLGGSSSFLLLGFKNGASLRGRLPSSFTSYDISCLTLFKDESADALYCATGSRIVRFNGASAGLDGTQTIFGNAGINETPDNSFFCTGFTLDTGGNLFVSDNNNGRVLVYVDARGATLNNTVATKVIGVANLTFAHGPGLFTSPGQQVWDAAKNQLLVSDTVAKVVFLFFALNLPEGSSTTAGGSTTGSSSSATGGGSSNSASAMTSWLSLF